MGCVGKLSDKDPYSSQLCGCNNTVEPGTAAKLLTVRLRTVEQKSQTYLWGYTVASVLSKLLLMMTCGGSNVRSIDESVGIITLLPALTI